MGTICSMTCQVPYKRFKDNPHNLYEVGWTEYFKVFLIPREKNEIVRKTVRKMLSDRDGRTEQLQQNGKLLLQAYYTVFFSNIELKRSNSE